MGIVPGGTTPAASAGTGERPERPDDHFAFRCHVKETVLHIGIVDLLLHGQAQLGKLTSDRLQIVRNLIGLIFCIRRLLQRFLCNGIRVDGKLG